MFIQIVTTFSIKKHVQHLLRTGKIFCHFKVNFSMNQKFEIMNLGKDLISYHLSLDT